MSGATKDGGFVLDDREAEQPVYVLSPNGKTLVRAKKPPELPGHLVRAESDN